MEDHSGRGRSYEDKQIFDPLARTGQSYEARQKGQWRGTGWLTFVPTRFLRGFSPSGQWVLWVAGSWAVRLPGRHDRVTGQTDNLVGGSAEFQRELIWCRLGIRVLRNAK
jgi:hypothetical protein